ncbi:MAG: ABC transporter permease [Candidatus Aenigmarchaeota archaeon]|nr:ABC transporter permease [Candidatus Aenigmarchaeota archaeon]
MKRAISFLLPLVVLVVFLEIVARSGIVNITLFPPPTAWGLALLEMAKSGELGRDIATSLWRALAGLVIGSVLGILAGLATGRIKAIESSLSPIFNVVRSFPPVAIIPLVIVWLGIGEPAKLFSISFAVFFPVWISAHTGAHNVPQNYLHAAKILSCTAGRKFSKVIFPSALPFIVAGIRIGISMAFIMVFVSELAGASAGLGYQISVSHLAYRIDRMIAALVVLGILAAFTDLLFTSVVRKYFHWVKKS